MPFNQAWGAVNMWAFSRNQSPALARLVDGERLQKAVFVGLSACSMTGRLAKRKFLQQQAASWGGIVHQVVLRCLPG